jgi:hypothetical protein
MLSFDYSPPPSLVTAIQGIERLRKRRRRGKLLSLSQLTGEGGRTQKRRYQKTIYVIPKYFLYVIALSETDNLICKF